LSNPLLYECKLLVVEDEYFLADDLARIFRAHGATIVGPVGHMEDALAALERGGFDAAVIDLNA
jgi:CheY-like chemotaxis protein